MKFGISYFPVEKTIRPDALAVAVEERGFESLFFPEHTHIPVSPTTREQMRDTPAFYAHTYDIFTAMSYAAAATSRLKIASGLLLLPQHDPIITAKGIASIDALSNGRVIFGIGAGWITEEMQNHGTHPNQRWAVMRDRVGAIRAIWSEDEAEYHGTFHDFGPIHSWPKPVQEGGPPILIGGNGPNVLKRVAEYGDGWMPVDNVPLETLADRARQLQEEAVAHGRNERIPVTLGAEKSSPEHVARAIALGFDRIVFTVTPDEPDAVLRKLDELVSVRETVIGNQVSAECVVQ